MSDLDPRDGQLTAWITATKADSAGVEQVLSAGELAPFAVLATIATAGNATVRVVSRKTVPCISVRGNREQRNAALARVGVAFYAANAKWLWTTDDFDWLKHRIGQS